jgi:DNA-3-methyladenine glycosylase II
LSPSLVLRPRAPFRLDLTVWALRRRELNAVDAWNGSTYRRVLVVDDEPIEVAMAQTGGTATPRLHLAWNGAPRRRKTRLEAVALLEKMLSLELDIDPFSALAEADPRLAPLAARFRGLHPPRFPSVFECLVNAVALQQLSLAAGLTLLNRLAHTFGTRSAAPGSLRHAFPTADELATVQPGSIHELGFSRRKAATIIAIANAASRGELDLDSLVADDDEHVV